MDTALAVPQVHPSDWRLRVSGLVARAYELSLDELLQMPLVEEYVTLVCVSNEVGGRLVGTARWLGVPLTDLLDRAGPRPNATQIVGRSVDGFTAGFPTAVALDGRPALVAVGMNGEPLPLEHGFPARLVVAGRYGYASATKWLTEIELTRNGAFDAYWVRRGWAKDIQVETQARIDVPGSGERLPPGRTTIAGVAWAPPRGISAVEVRIDRAPWTQARLANPLSEFAWRQWAYEWEAVPGRYTIEARATDGRGRLQTARDEQPFGAAATGVHRIEVQVRER